MKITPILAVLLLPAVLCTSCHPSALLQSYRDTWDITCDLQIVSVPEELALPLVPNLRDPHRVEGAFKDVQKLLAEKRATLIGWPILITKSGQRAVVEQIDEVRYATEYQAPSASPTPATQFVDQPAQTASKPDAPAYEATPTAFETRNTGVTFEAEPVISADGEMIEVNMVPQSVRLLGWTKATIEKDPPGIKVTVDQPRFFTNKITNSMTFHNGERRLIGLFKVSEPAGNVELFILRVDATKRKVAVEKPPPPSLGPSPGSSSSLAPTPPQ